MPSPQDTARQDIVTICRHLYYRGFIAGTEGNVSVRAATNRLWITPSGVHKGFLRPEDLLLLETSGQVCLGSGQPSSETPMHLMIYRCRPDVQAVIHAHPPIATALTVAGYEVETTLLPEAVVVLGEVPTLPYQMPTTWEFAETVGHTMQQAEAVMLANHGSVAVGRSLQAAFNTMETVERVAQIFYTAKTLGRVHHLPAAEVQALQALRT